MTQTAPRTRLTATRGPDPIPEAGMMMMAIPSDTTLTATTRSETVLTQTPSTEKTPVQTTPGQTTPNETVPTPQTENITGTTRPGVAQQGKGAPGTADASLPSTGSEAARGHAHMGNPDRSDEARRLLADIRRDLAQIDEVIAKVAHPAARVQLELGRAQLMGSVADLTGDRQASQNYGAKAPQVPIGAQDLAEHGDRIRARFADTTRTIGEDASRIGLDLKEIGARLSLGRAVPQGLVKHWEELDLLSVLSRSGKTLEMASTRDLDRAEKTVEGVQSKILEVFQQVVRDVRHEVRHEIDRVRGTERTGFDASGADRAPDQAQRGRGGRAPERAASRGDGISL